MCSTRKGRGTPLLSPLYAATVPSPAHTQPSAAVGFLSPEQGHPLQRATPHPSGHLGTHMNPALPGAFSLPGQHHLCTLRGKISPGQGLPWRHPAHLHISKEIFLSSSLLFPYSLCCDCWGLWQRGQPWRGDVSRAAGAAGRCSWLSGAGPGGRGAEGHGEEVSVQNLVENSLWMRTQQSCCCSRAATHRITDVPAPKASGDMRWFSNMQLGFSARTSQRPAAGRRDCKPQPVLGYIL